MRLGKGRNHLYWWLGDTNPIKGVPVDNALLQEPGKEDTDAPQIGIDGMPGESPLLCLVQGMIIKATLLLEIENEGPDIKGGNLSHICTGLVSGEKLLQVAYAAGDDGDGVGTLTIGGSIQPITMK